MLCLCGCSNIAEHDFSDCIFCEIKTNPHNHYTIWEDDDYMAFLSIYPNTDGVTVVIPKSHYSSNVDKINNKVLVGLVIAAKEVTSLLKLAFPDVGRFAFVIEGLGVNHLHIKLFPLHGTADPQRKFKSKINVYSATYEGYISTHNYYDYPQSKLKQIHKHILQGKSR
jgi:diadenosine tetraphosphate (Ap4A) HIT family hydrolase